MAKRQKTDIHDVAEAAGVSVSTVSRALNGYSDVSAKTRRKVEKVAAKMGYQPHFGATVLRKNATRTITFMVSKPWAKFVDPYFLAVLDGLELALATQSYDLQVVLARDFDQEQDVVRRIVERNRSDALIFARTRPEDERIDWLEKRKFPFVTIGQTNRNSHSFIDRDQCAIAKEATLRLAGLGHQSIAHFMTPLRYTYSVLGRAGYREAMEECGLGIEKAIERECFLSRNTGEEMVLELFAKGRAPTAILCGNDMIAISAMEGLKRLGLQPGIDVALIGCDDIPLAAHVHPSLTSFSQDLDAMGMRLSRMVLAQLGEDGTVEQEVVQSRLIIRESDCVVPNVRKNLIRKQSTDGSGKLRSTP